jgi:hypothetical protein
VAALVMVIALVLGKMILLILLRGGGKIFYDYRCPSLFCLNSYIGINSKAT